MKKDAVKDVWNANAEFWDSRMGEGNRFHKTLIEPVQLKMLDIKPGMKILDVACGNGQFARKMAEMGAKVTAIDFSEKLIEIARAKSGKNINYQVIDVTKTADLRKLSGTKHDAIVCTMAFMDMKDIKTLIKFPPKLLKKYGSFVFSLCHPCFNSGEFLLVHERDDANGEVTSNYFVKVKNYLVERSYQGVAIVGQPKLQHYFHRPVSTILSYFFQNGFVLDSYQEPSYKEVQGAVSIFQKVYQNIPPALVCRLKLLA
ncbi:MAG TPA: methyltransferase domain-containing protein [Dehalococcoidales bacterium]